MSLDAAWAIGISAHFATMGVPAVVTRPVPNDTPIETTVIWHWPTMPADPYGSDRAQVDPKRIASVPKTDTLPALPRGTMIEAAEVQGGATKTWRVDGYANAALSSSRSAAVSPDEMRVFVVER